MLISNRVILTILVACSAFSIIYSVIDTYVSWTVIQMEMQNHPIKWRPNLKASWEK